MVKMAEAEQLPNVQTKGRTEVPPYKLVSKQGAYAGPEIMDFESVSAPMSPAQLAKTKERYLKFVRDRTAELKPQFDLLRKTDSQEKRAALLGDILDRMLLNIWQNLTYENKDNLLDVFFSLRQDIPPPMKADCDMSTIICGDILQQQGIQAKLVALHQRQHAILKVIDGKTSIYIETTSTPTVFGNQIAHSYYDELEFKSRYHDGYEFDLKAETAYNYIRRTDGFLGRGKLEDARASAAQAMKLDPNYEGSYYARGSVEFESKEFENAKNDLQAALKLNQRYYSARAVLGKTELFLGDFEAAEKTATALLFTDPDKPSGYEIKGAVREQKKQYEEAMDFYEKAMALEDDPRNKAELERRVVSISLRLISKSKVDSNKSGSGAHKKEVLDGVQIFKQEIEKATEEIEDSPDDFKRYAERGCIYMRFCIGTIPNTNFLPDRNERKTYNELAVADFEKALELNPRYREGYKMIAERCVELYDLTRAEIYKQRAIHSYSEMKWVFPDDASPSQGLGHIFYAIGEYAAAAKEYEECIKKLKNAQRPYTGMLTDLGFAYQALQKYDDAERCFQDMHLDRSVISASGKSGTMSVPAYDKHEEDIKLQLGNLYLKQGKYGKALEVFSDIGDIANESIESVMGCGDAYLSLRDYKKALKYYDRAVKSSEKIATHRVIWEKFENLSVVPAILAHQKRGDLKLLRGDAEGANKDYERIFELMAPDKRLLEIFQYGWPLGGGPSTTELGKILVSVKVNQARAHHVLGRYQDAISEFQSLLTSNPNDLALLCHLGDSYSAAGNNADAILAYEKAAKNNPNFALPHLRLARIYAALGRKEDAKKELAKIKYMSNLLYDELGNPATLPFDSAKPDKTNVKKN